MTENKTGFPVFYFDRWQDPTGVSALEAQDSGVALTLLDSNASEDSVWPMIEAALGYQIGSAKDELPERYWADDAFLARTPQLLAICAHGAGYDTLDLGDCTAAGVVVCNQAGGNAEAVAEHTLGMMLSLSKHIHEANLLMRRNRNWSREQFRGRDLRSKTLGIVGIGHIGQRVAELCGGPLGMRVLAYDPLLTEAEIRSRHAEPAAFDALLAASDVVSVHCPLNDETRGMFGRQAFSAMREGSYFLITARGGIVDEAALVEALAEGPLAGAGIDVFNVEPPPLDHPLLTFDNVILTPHTAGITDDARVTTALGAANQWRALAAGQVPPRIVNPEVWPRFRKRYRDATGRDIPPLAKGL